MLLTCVTLLEAVVQMLLIDVGTMVCGVTRLKLRFGLVSCTNILLLGFTCLMLFVEVT